MSAIQGTENANGGLEVAQIRELVVQLSRELSAEERQASRNAREEELQKGLAAAEELRDKACELSTGACVSGALSMASGGLEFLGSLSLDKVADDASTKAIEARIQSATTLGQLAAPANQIFQAQGEKDAANAQSLDAEGKAAGHRADEAEANRQTLAKTEDSVKNLELEISRTLHSGMMAILARQ
jgi:hypothetical protein